MARRLGALGESSFKSLCDAVGLIANKSYDDMYGWDYYVEFPADISKSIFLNIDSSPIECKIQIKATDNFDKKVQLKLSSLIRLVKTHNPSFIIMMEFNQQNFPQSLYLIHVDSVLMEKVLKKERECSVKNKKINKVTLTLQYGEKNKINNISGECLQNEIKKYISNGMNDYVIRKDNLLKTLGFDHNSMSMKVIFSEEVSTEKLIDMSIGLSSEEVSCNVSNMSQRRFGIEVSEDDPFKEASIFMLSIYPEPISKARLQIKTSQYAVPIILEADFYSSPFNTFDEAKVLFKADFFSFTMEDPGLTGKINFDLEYEKDYEFSKIYLFASLMNMMILNEALFLEIEVDNSPKLEFMIESEFYHVYKSFSLFDTCEQLTKLYELTPFVKQNLFSINDLEKSHKAINVLHTMKFEKLEKMMFTFQYITTNEIENDSELIQIVPIPILLKENIIGKWLIFKCKVTVNETLVCEARPYERIENEVFFIPYEEYDLAYFDKQFEKICNEITNENKLKILFVDYLLQSIK